jgi:diguanylate cyclase (GGDEF)-like protein/PAS domain S-box-containing protein
MELQFAFLILLAGSVIISLGLSLYAFTRRDVPGSIAFAIMLLGESVWAFSTAYEIAMPNLSNKLIWDNIQFLGKDVMAAAMFFFVLVFVGRKDTANRAWKLLIIEPVISFVLVWTEPFHNFVRISPVINPSGSFSVLEYGFGPGAWGIALYEYLLMFLGFIILLAQFFRTPHIHRLQISLILFGMLLPLSGSLMTNFGLAPIVSIPHLDLSPFLFIITNPIWALSLFRLRADNIIHFARQTIFDNMKNIMIVVNTENQILNMNKAAQSFIGLPLSRVSLQPLTLVIPGLYGIAKDMINSRLPEAEISLQEGRRKRHYALNRSPFHDQNGLLSGWIIILSDITERVEAQEAERAWRKTEETLRAVGTTLSTTLDFNQVLDQVLELIKSVIPYDSANIMMIERRLTRSIRTFGYDKYGEGIDRSVASQRIEIEKVSNLKWMLQNKKPMVIPDISVLPGWMPEDIGVKIRSWVGAPILAHDKVIGFFSLDKSEPGSFTATHMEHLATFASQAALAMENARLYTNMGIALKREQRLNKVTRIINTALDINAILRDVLKLSLELLDADRADLGLLTPDGENLQFHYIVKAGGELELSENLIPKESNELSWKIIESGRPVLITDPEIIKKQPGDLQEMGATSVIAVPVGSGGMTQGVLGLFQLDLEKQFSRRDLSLAESIGHQAGIAIQNTHLFGDVQRLATTDSLTGWYNRRYFFELAEIEFERSLRYQHPLSIIIFDLDNFKDINDEFGHLVGDQVLQTVTRRIQSVLRRPDIWGRYGGEEFVVLLPETDIDAAAKAAERVRNTIADEQIETSKGAVPVTISVGAASFYGQITSTIDTLLDMADQALLSAKSGGRNRVVIWTEIEDDES